MELPSNSKIQAINLIQEICNLRIHQKYLSKAFALIMEHIFSNLKEAFELCKITNVNSFSEESIIILRKTNFSNTQMENFRRIDPDIQSILDRVSADDLGQNPTNLSGFHTRHSKSLLLNDVSNRLMNQFKVKGYKDTFYHSYEATIDNEEFLLSSNVFSP